MNLKHFDRQMKEQASPLDWMMFALYAIWICAVQANLMISNSKLFYPLLIPNIAYVILLCFVLYKRKQEKKDAWVVVHALLLIFTLVFIGVYYWLNCTATTLP